MSFAYTNLADAQQHLSQSVIMYDGRPVWVEQVTEDGHGDFRLTMSHLPRLRDPVVVDLFDPLVDPRKVRLGYVNALGHALYLTRMPARQYKQGLCRTNCAISTVNGQAIIRFENLLTQGGFSDALRSVYPTYEEAEDLIKNGSNRSVAFDRTYALERDDLGFYRLFYRGEPVAFGESKKFKLPEKYRYLAEEITELGVTVV